MNSYSCIDWNKDPGKYCDQFWNGWDEILTDKIKKEYQIVDIGEYNILFKLNYGVYIQLVDWTG